jgi:hypothetical protein
MSRSTSSRVVGAVVALVLAACAGDPPVLAICARGDRAVLAAEVASLELRFFDASGTAIGTPVTLDAHDTHIGPDLPGDAARVSAIGFDAGGVPIATGDAALASGGRCVCFALDSQALAACRAVTCDVIEDRCRFYDDQGAPLGSQTLGFGERADVTAVTTDTYLQEDEPSVGHEGPILKAGPTPNRVGLIRFELSALPKTAVIEAATLRVRVCTATDCGSSETLSLLPALEAWREDATWLQREPGMPWAQPGCGTPGSCAAASLGNLPGAVAGTSLQAPLAVGPIAAWVADPATNLGFAIVRPTQTGTALHLDASETAAADGEPPRLDVTYHLE